MKKTSKIIALLLVMAVAVASLFTLVGCDEKKPGPGGDKPGKDTQVNYQNIDDADVILHEDTTSVYDEIGASVTIDQVVEDEEGVAFVTVDGVKYELGMDFLSMAMVYNCSVPADSAKYQSEEDVYNEWWKLYIQRWNKLAPEVPLYSNIYYDLYNAKIEGLVTTPYFSPMDAIIAATIPTGESKVILGSSTQLSGAFRASSWGKSSPGSADLDIEKLTSGYDTVQTSNDGALMWNMKSLAEIPTSTINADGTLTYTIKVRNDMVFSDGSAINAKNFVASILCNSSAVGVAAGGTGTSGSTIVGFKAYKDAINGVDADNNKVYFEGIKILGDYEFSVTFTADYAGYYYAQANAAFAPSPLALYLPDADIEIDPETKSVRPTDAFYAQVEENDTKVYTAAAKIKNNLKWNSGLPYSGPYYVHNYDESTNSATLKLNTNYPGDDARGVATIETIAYIKTVEETQMDMFAKGEVDVIAGITGGEETKAALKLVSENPEKYAETHYDRAGYGKLGFRADFGPTGMTEVRQAIMYTINRPAFAQNFTGGFGGVVHGPYYAGSSAFKANADTIKLNQYAFSSESAIEVLEEAGWIYNGEGKAFDAEKDAVRYKKLSGFEKSKDNLHFASIDNKYKTVKIDGEYYMPLAINWFGTQPNSVTDQLLTEWAQSKTATSEIGMYITYTSTDFVTGLYGEFMRSAEDGYNGTPKLNAINFATGFTSAIYDFAFNWSVNPDYEPYSTAYLFDEADYLENYSK